MTDEKSVKYEVSGMFDKGHFEVHEIGTDNYTRLDINDLMADRLELERLRSNVVKALPQDRLFVVQDIFFESRTDGEKVLSALRSLNISGPIEVASLYELVGISPVFNDTKFGWESTAGMHVQRTAAGFKFGHLAPQFLG